MKISFEYSYFDYAALVRAQKKQSRFSAFDKPVFWGIVLLNFIFSAIFVGQALFQGEEVKLIYFFKAVLAALILLVAYLVYPYYLRQYYKKQMIDGKEVKLAFDETGMSVEMPEYNGTHKWKAIIGADEEPEHFLLWINKVQGYCIPKRAFETEGDAEAFKVLVASRVERQALVK